MKCLILFSLLIYTPFALSLTQKNEKNECVEFKDSIAKQPEYKLIGCEKSAETADKISLKCKAETEVIIYPDVEKCKKDGGIVHIDKVVIDGPVEVTYRRLQATPEKYIGKSVVLKCEVKKYNADRGVLEAHCGSIGDSTSGPCIYTNNDWICLAVPKEKREMIDYLIDNLTPGTSSTVKILGKLRSKKIFDIQEMRFCNATMIECEPYAKVLK
ncbi:MAG: hypothetical protein J0M15_16890 [Deltaproteobacteria bacterium]|jgi:hypothetical protein|nr:hypothetical protein [Deltaproteobacteria bacterium]